MSSPCRFITTSSNFMLWPIFSTERSSSSGFSSGERLADRDLALEQAAAEQVAGAGAVGDRHIGGAARRRRQREADEVGLHRIGRGGLGVEGDDAGLARLGDPGLERRQVADADIGVDVDLGRDRRLGAQWRPASRARCRGRLAVRARGSAAIGGRRDAARAGGLVAERQFRLRLERDAAGSPRPAHARRRRVDLDRRRLDRREVGARSPRRRGGSASRIPSSSGSRSASARSAAAARNRRAPRRPARRSSASPARARCAPCRHWR